MYNIKIQKSHFRNIMIVKNILKEWSSAFKFFELKKYGLIFRKGGIHERQFDENDGYFGIFKTFEHESNGNIKDSYKSLLSTSNDSYTGEFDLEYACKIQNSFIIPDIESLNIIDDYHPWKSEYLIERFNFRKSKDMKAYILEIQKLKIPKKVNYDVKSAKGCKSWFELENPTNTFTTIKINDPMNENKIINILKNL